MASPPRADRASRSSEAKTPGAQLWPKALWSLLSAVPEPRITQGAPVVMIFLFLDQAKSQIQGLPGCLHFLHPQLCLLSQGFSLPLAPLICLLPRKGSNMDTFSLASRQGRKQHNTSFLPSHLMFLSLCQVRCSLEASHLLSVSYCNFSQQAGLSGREVNCMFITHTKGHTP